LPLLVTPNAPPDCPDEYPQNISFTEYSLQGTSYQWQNLPYDEKVIIINNSEELAKYISCTESTYPAIDFSKYSLLLTSGKLSSGISNITTKKFQQLSANKYELCIEAEVHSSILNRWNAAILVDKLSEESYVGLKVKRIEVYPIDIPFERYLLTSDSCQWIRFQGATNTDTVVAINSKEELENYIECIGESNYLEVDFSKYTLLLAYGMVPSGGGPNYISMRQFSKQSYIMKVNIPRSWLPMAVYWHVPIIVGKITDDSVVELIITRNP